MDHNAFFAQLETLLQQRVNWLAQKSALELTSHQLEDVAHALALNAFYLIESKIEDEYMNDDWRAEGIYR